MGKKTIFHYIGFGVVKAHAVIAHVLLWIASVLMSLMALGVLLQVLMRYVFNNPVPWIEEFSVYSMFIMSFFAGPYLILYKLNVSMTLFYDKVTNKIFKLLLNLFLHSLILFGCIRLLPNLLTLIQNSMSVMATQIPISKGQLYSVVPLSLVLMATITIQHFVQDILSFFKKEDVSHKEAGVSKVQE